MATLTGSTIASTYTQLLKLTSVSLGADASAKYIEDGAGTDSALSISTTRVGIGTAAPAQPFHVVKVANIQARFEYNGANYLDVGYNRLDASADLGFYIAGSNKMSINAAGDILPGATEAQDLGSSGLEWDNVFLQNSATVSDERRKEQIEDSPLGLDFVNQLRPVKYKRKNWTQKIEVSSAIEAVEGIEAKDAVYEDMKMEYQRKHYGLIAQEVKGVLDNMGIDTQDFGGYVDANIKDGVDKLFLRYDEFISPLIKAVQELSAKVEALENA